MLSDVGKMTQEKITRRPNLSMLALVSFMASFAVARTFVILSPTTVVLSFGVHIHHFWYGLVMIVIGGWLGISYQNELTDRIAAILFGAGGGLVADEFGLLLTMDNYWTEITYTFVVVFLTFASIALLLKKYSSAVRREFAEFVSNRGSLFFGIFLALVSVAIILRATDIILIIASGVFTAVACAIVIAYFVQRFRKRK
jgi:hypothetical protein